jgi:hypothetical protein
MPTPKPTPRPGRNNTRILEVLNYALTFENFESEFFKQGLAKFNESSFTDAGFNATVRDRLALIGEHDKAHASALTSVIKSMKGKPVGVCNYSFPMDNVTEFLGFARGLETAGVSAYIGAASHFRGNLSTIAASIIAVEARHAAYLNGLFNLSGIPYAFDTALGPREVATLGARYITSCPFNSTIKPFAQLNVTFPEAGSNSTGSNSTKVSTYFDGPGSDSNSTYCQFLFGNNVTVSPRSECALPDGIKGYVYLLITKNNNTFTVEKDSNVLAGPVLLFNGTHFNSTQTNGAQTNGTQST